MVAYWVLCGCQKSPDFYSHKTQAGQECFPIIFYYLPYKFHPTLTNI